VVKRRAAATRGERLKDLYGSDEEFQRRMEVEQARLEEFSSTHKLQDEIWMPRDVIRYRRITLRFSTIQKIWDAIKGAITLIRGK
jgi:calcineurin-like phosphoesterase family protein